LQAPGGPSGAWQLRLEPDRGEVASNRIGRATCKERYEPLL
jgi:hypothetical protein